MGVNLTNLYIDETFEKLTQISGSKLTDGLGNDINLLDITASYALNTEHVSASYALSASHADNADTSILADTASLLIGNAEGVGHIDFINTAETTIERRLNWNDTDGTLNIGLKGGNVSLQVGQELVTRVVNKTGADLLEANYKVVKVLGAQGNRLSVSLALADADINSASTLGLVTENIDVNQEGFITTEGLVRGINTTGALQGETWNEGDILYLSGVTPGGITNVKPATPTHLITLGYVVAKNPSVGSIFVKVNNGYELEELHDVLITNPTNGEALVYENGIWVNSDIPHVSASYAVSASQAEVANGVVNISSAGSSYILGGNLGDDTVYRTSLLISGGNAIQANGGFFGNLIGNANTATSASYAVTASYAENANVDSGSWDGQFEGDAGITGSLTFTGVSAFIDMGTGVAAQIKNANNIIGNWGQTNGTHTLQVNGNVSATTGFTGSLNGNADTATSASYAVTASYALTSEPQVSASYASLAENLTVGAKTHDGVFQQTVPMPAPFNETDFYTVTGANAGVYHIGLQDYTPYGEKFVHQGYLSEQFDSFGFNYGSAMGNSLTGCGYFLVPQGGGGTDAAVTTQDNGDGTATTAARGHKVNINGYNGVTISGSVFSQNDITAPNFIGNLQGNANTATTAISSSYAATAPYSGLQGTVPTWNQDTTGNADTATNLTPGNKTLNGSINQTFTAPGAWGNISQTTINGAVVGATAYNNFTVGVQDIPAFGSGYEDCYILECYDSFGYNYGSEFKVNGVAAGFFMYPQTGGFGDPAGVQVLDSGIAGSQVQIYAKTIDFGLAGNTSTIGIGNTNSTTTMAGDLTLNSLGNYADDATAAANGVPINGVYRNGNILQIRIV